MTKRKTSLVLVIVMFSSMVGHGSAHIRPGTTRQVDVDPSGGQPDEGRCGQTCNYVSNNGSLSGDGRFVAFHSYGTDLVKNDINQAQDIFVRDMRTKRTVRASVSSDGAQAIGINTTGGGLWNLSRNPVMSANGNFVAFESDASNLVAGDTNGEMDIFVHDLRPHKRTTERVSVDSKGGQKDPIKDLELGPIDADVSWPTISGNGRYVAFVGGSTVLDLVENDTNTRPDIFVHDRKTGKTVIASNTHDNRPQNGFTFDPEISPNGRYIAFTGHGTNLVPNDLNRAADVFVRDLRKNKLYRVSVATDGTEGTDPVGMVSLQPGGSQTLGVSNSGDVAFTSVFSNLVPSDTNRATDLFVHSLKTRRTTRVSVFSTGAQASRAWFNVASSRAISASGRHVVFQSDAGFVDEDDDSRVDAYVYDRTVGTVDLVSAADNDKQIDAGRCEGLGGVGTFCLENGLPTSISDDGRYVSFITMSPEARRPPRGTPKGHIFVRDRGATVGGGLAAHRIGFGTATSRSRAGSVRAVDPADEINPALARLGADLVESTLAFRPGTNDLFLRLGVTDMPAFDPITATTIAPIVYGVDLETAAGRFRLRSIDSVSTDAGLNFELVRCRGRGCRSMGIFRGYHGTTGFEVVVTVPGDALGLARGGRISGLTAFTALREVPGPSGIVDELHLGA